MQKAPKKDPIKAARSLLDMVIKKTESPRAPKKKAPKRINLKKR